MWMRRMGGPRGSIVRIGDWSIGSVQWGLEKKNLLLAGKVIRGSCVVRWSAKRTGLGGRGLLLSWARAPYNAPPDGEVPERSIGAVSKTVVPLAGTQGSNPCLSAIVTNMA